MKIEAETLTTCSVIDDGDAISLGMTDRDGQAVELKVSASNACAIAMTLPRLLKNSIQTKYRDDTLRYTFPLDGWQVEAASDGANLIVTLKTGEEFEVSFSTKPDMCKSLAQALGGDTEHGLELAIPVTN